MSCSKLSVPRDLPEPRELRSSKKARFGEVTEREMKLAAHLNGKLTDAQVLDAVRTRAMQTA